MIGIRVGAAGPVRAVSRLGRSPPGDSDNIGVAP